MAESLGIYNGPNNTGFATQVQSTSGFFDSYGAGLDEAYRRQKEDEQTKYNRDQAAQAEKTRQKERLENTALNFLDPSKFQTWSKVSDRVESTLREGIQKGATQGFQIGDIMDVATRASRISSAGNQLKQVYDQGIALASRDPRINQGAYQEAFSRQFIEPLVSGDDSILYAAEPTPSWFTETPGGSAQINQYEAIKKFVSDDMLGWVRSTVSGPKTGWQNSGHGLLNMTSEQVEREYQNYVTYDETTGEVSVKDVEGLIDSGLLVAAKADPFMNRIVEDKGKEIADLMGTPMTDVHRARALRELLRPTARATYSRSEVVSTQVNPYARMSTSAKPPKYDQELRDYWIATVQGNGNPATQADALSYITNTMLTKGRVLGTSSPDEDGNISISFEPEIPSGSRRTLEGKNSQSDFEQGVEIIPELRNAITFDRATGNMTFNPKNLSRAQLLLFYEATRSKIKEHWANPKSPGFQEFALGGGQIGTPTITISEEESARFQDRGPVAPKTSNLDSLLNF